MSAELTSELEGRRVTVWGLGSFGGGVAAARFLARAGARVTVTDLKPAAELAASVAALEGLGVRFVLGEHREEDLLGADLVVQSPAIPPSAAWVRRLTEAGVPVTSEIVLGLERLGAPFALVTGSKGKSTTASLLGAMVGGAGAPVRVVGNNERPLLDALEAGLPPDCRVVVEVSSFMAHHLAQARRPLPRPEVVVFTGLEPEHLNWHGALEAYYGAKLSLLDLKPPRAVYPGADPELAARVPPRAGAADLVRTWPDGAPGDVGSRDVVARDGWAAEGDARLFALETLQLLGAHNRANALLAAAGARALGAGADAIAAGAAGFAPLPHRLETVALGRVRFVNDSMATTPTAATAALRAIEGPLVLIAGGSDKGVALDGLAREAAARAAAVVCLGEVREALARAAEAAVAEGAGRAEVVRAEGFDQAFAQACARCPDGGTVLLAPGTASYDMFPNFKARGERFRALAREAGDGGRC